MTLEDYNTATELLADIEKLDEIKTAAEQSVRIEAQARSLSEFLDVEQIKLDAIAAIDADIIAKQNAFEAL